MVCPGQTAMKNALNSTSHKFPRWGGGGGGGGGGHTLYIQVRNGEVMYY